MRDSLKYMWYALRRSPLSVTGFLLILCMVTIAAFAPLITPCPPNQINIQEGLQGPSLTHLAGTDILGRDIFSRIVYGTRVALKIAIVVVAVAATLGTLIGAVSGLVGGFLDTVLMRVTDIFLSIPRLVLAMVAAAALGPSITNMMIALSIVWWTWYARMVRGEVLALKSLEFIQAAKVSGASQLRIILRHLLPNCMGIILVQTSLQMGYAVLTSAGLSFLGLGAQEPTASWGLMISTGREYLPEAWWITTFPGIAIFLLVTGFLLLGDGLRDIMAREV